MDKIHVLVVDDREENRRAAKEFFNAIENLIVDYATHYNEAVEKLNDGTYSVVISDLMFPKTDGGKEEELGWELINEVERQQTPYYAVISSGVDHHRCRSAFAWFPGMKQKVDEMGGGRCRLTEIPKTSPESWKIVFEALYVEKDLALMVQESLKRFKGIV